MRDEPLRHLARAERERDQHRRAGGRRSSAPTSSTEAASAQWRSSSTSTSGCVCGQALEQLAHRTVAAVTLVLERRRRAAARRGQRGEDVCELGLRRRRRAASSRLGSSPSHVLVQGVHEHPERHVALEFRAEPASTRCLRVSARVGELREQARLADPGLAHDLDAPRHARRRARRATRSTTSSSRLRPTNWRLDGPIYPRTARSRRPTGCEDQGVPLMSARPARRQPRPMTRYLLHHSHEPHECGVVFASFKGHESPLRHQSTLASCRSGGHAIWWTVEAAAEEAALGLLPSYVAERTTVSASARCRSHDPRRGRDVPHQRQHVETQFHPHANRRPRPHRASCSASATSASPPTPDRSPCPPGRTPAI